MLRNQKIPRATILWIAIGALLALDTVLVMPAHAAEEAALAKVTPTLGSEQRSLKLIAVSPVLAGGHAAGAIAIYDDPVTRRPEDYLEMYDTGGDLVLVAWFDAFGIQRVAMERALLEGRGPRGDFVVFVAGVEI